VLDLFFYLTTTLALAVQLVAVAHGEPILGARWASWFEAALCGALVAMLGARALFHWTDWSHLQASLAALTLVNLTTSIVLVGLAWAAEDPRRPEP
jgi:hypothetical protein